MKKYLKIVLLVIVAIILVGTFVFLYQKSRPKVVVYETLKPEVTDLQKTTVATGKVEPRDEILIKPQISGIIDEVYKEAGQAVRKGEVIAKVKVIPELGQLNSAESRVRLAEINATQADTDFSRVIVLEKDVEGHITALRTDMAQVERLKVEVLELLDTLVAQINTQQMGIPLGNLLLPDLLAGTGPELPVKAVSLTMSNADFFSDFTAAGINQTLQTLKVKFTISLTIPTTVGYETVDVDSDVMLAQTVIVGTVPETYVNLGHLTTTEGWEQYGTETGN